MGFIKVNSTWVSKKEDFVGPSVGPSRNVRIGDDVGPSVNVKEDYTMHVLVSYEPLVDHGIPISPFERQMINRMDTMTRDKKDHYELCETQFQYLNERIEVVQTQLAEFQYGRDI